MSHECYECPGCGAQESDPALCRRCAAKLRHDLEALPDLMADLDDVLTRQTQTGTGNGNRRSRDRPLIFDQAASITRGAVVNTITTWVRDLDYGDFDAGPTMRAWCSWLADHIDRIRYHKAAGQIFDELTYAVADVRRTVDLPAPRIPYGTCEICNRTMTGPRDAEEVTCHYCALEGIEVVKPVERGHVGLWRKADDQLVTRRDALEALPLYGLEVKPETFRSWVKREQLVRREDPKRPDRTLYRFGDVLDLAKRRGEKVS